MFKNLPGRHAIFRQEWNFKNFGAGQNYFLAGGGHSFPGDPVHLVEGVRPQVAVVCCANEHLQVDGLLAVANELRHRGGRRRRTRNFNSREGSRSKSEGVNKVKQCLNVVFTLIFLKEI